MISFRTNLLHEKEVADSTLQVSFPLLSDSNSEYVQPFTLVRRLYAEKSQDEVKDMGTKVVSLSLPLQDAALLSAIARHFSLSTSALGVQLFPPLTELLSALEIEDRKKVTLEADREISEFLHQKFNTPLMSEDGTMGLICWQRVAKHMNQLEADQIKARQKDLDDAENNNEPV